MRADPGRGGRPVEGAPASDAGVKAALRSTMDALKSTELRKPFERPPLLGEGVSGVSGVGGAGGADGGVDEGFGRPAPSPAGESSIVSSRKLLPERAPVRSIALTHHPSAYQRPSGRGWQ